MNSPLIERIAQEHARANVAGASPFALERRRAALAHLLARGLPGRRDENWKYANLRPLERARFAPPLAAPQAGALRREQLPAEVGSYRRFTFVDGLLAPELSSELADFEGVRIATLRDAASAPVAAEDPDARFALLNEAFAADGALITAARGAQCPQCIELVFVATGAAASYPRIELHAAENAYLGLIERHVSLSSDVQQLVSPAVRVRLERNARLEHYRVQQCGESTLWIDTLDAQLSPQASYQLHSIALGASSAHSTVKVQLQERAACSMYSAAVAARTQTHDLYVLMEHCGAHSLSRQSFRGIGADRARVACNSKVVVREGARGADSHQSLKGLLAGTDAEIDVRPQLEIYTDDVRCAHGATAGKLDETMLFYLLSRGLEPETAQLLLKWAFLEDVVSQVRVPQLRRQIEQSVAGRMSAESALSELL